MKTSICSGLLILTLIQSGFAQRGRWMQQRLERNFDRNSAPTTGPAPDYSNLYDWAASPFKNDPADSIPAFLKGEKRDTLADVFFIHPTTFGTGIHSASDAMGQRTNLWGDLKNAAWNADLRDTSLNQLTDLRTIRYQASAFNASCRVFAPRYRQASLKAFLVRESPEAQAAFALAYSDVKKAFVYYLEHHNQGRPIVIASHSQGSLHAIRLLQEFFDGKPLRNQLVCAYVIGYQIEKQAFRQLPMGTSPTQTGCFVGWRTYQQGEVPRSVQDERGNSQCVNPLSWTTATDWVSANVQGGPIPRVNDLTNQPMSARIEPQSGILWVKLPDGMGNRVATMKNLHVLDVNLFWMNIRENVRERILAYRKQNGR